MAQQAAEDYGSVLSLRRHFCREAEICPSERFCGVVVRGDGEIVFVVGSPRRLRLSRKDLEEFFSGILNVIVSRVKNRD